MAANGGHLLVPKVMRLIRSVAPGSEDIVGPTKDATDLQSIRLPKSSVTSYRRLLRQQKQNYNLLMPESPKTPSVALLRFDKAKFVRTPPTRLSTTRSDTSPQARRPAIMFDHHTHLLEPELPSVS